jgi:hypothetical protein
MGVGAPVILRICRSRPQSGPPRRHRPPRLFPPEVSTPLVVDGVLYFVGSMNVVRAVDATSGQLLWEYDPRVRDHARRMQAGWDHNRSLLIQSAEAFAEVVRDGARVADGMPVYPDLSDEELLEVRHYIRQQAELGLNREAGS